MIPAEKITSQWDRYEALAHRIIETALRDYNHAMRTDDKDHVRRESRSFLLGNGVMAQHWFNVAGMRPFTPRELIESEDVIRELQRENHARNLQGDDEELYKLRNWIKHQKRQQAKLLRQVQGGAD